MPKGAFRALVVTSPPTKGYDVHALQKAINRLHDEYKLPKVKTDSNFGLATLGYKRKSSSRPGRGARGVGYYLGAADAQLAPGTPISKHLQTIIRAPWRRTPFERVRGRKRYIRRRKELRANVGPNAALAWAHKQIGTREWPPRSNTGPGIATWTRHFGFIRQPWCGAFVGYALYKAGLNPSASIAFVPNLRWLYRRIAWEARKPGDIVAIRNHSHMGILDYDRRHTIEGNTNGGGSANGGMVMRHRRPLYEISAVYRPRWR